MIGLAIVLFVIFGMCWLGYKVTGFMLGAIFWLCVRLPLALILIGAGIAFCATILFIPLGIGCFRIAGGVMA